MTKNQLFKLAAATLLLVFAVLAWLMKTLEDELSAFRLWRNRQQPEKLAVVERLPDTPEQLQLEGPRKN